MRFCAPGVITDPVHQNVLSPQACLFIHVQAPCHTQICTPQAGGQTTALKFTRPNHVVNVVHCTNVAHSPSFQREPQALVLPAARPCSSCNGPHVRYSCQWSSALHRWSDERPCGVQNTQAGGSNTCFLIDGQNSMVDERSRSLLTRPGRQYATLAASTHEAPGTAFIAQLHLEEKHAPPIAQVIWLVGCATGTHIRLLMEPYTCTAR